VTYQPTEQILTEQLTILFRPDARFAALNLAMVVNKTVRIGTSPAVPTIARRIVAIEFFAAAATA
jgi:hypothetical protein